MAAMNAFTPLPPAAVSSTAPPAVTAARRRIGPPRPVEAAAGIHSRRRRKDSKIFLWQFLLDILGNARHTHIIQWTKEMEFKVSSSFGILGWPLFAKDSLIFTSSEYKQASTFRTYTILIVIIDTQTK